MRPIDVNVKTVAGMAIMVVLAMAAGVVVALVPSAAQLTMTGLAIVGLSAGFLGFNRTVYATLGGAFILAGFTTVQVVPSITVSDVLLVAAIGLGAISHLIERRRAVPLPGWLYAAAGMFLAVGIFHELVPPPPSHAAMYFPDGLPTTSNLDGVFRLELSLLAVPIAALLIATTAVRIRLLANLWLAGVVVGSLIGIAAYFGLIPGDTFSGGARFAAQRIRGVTAHPNSYGHLAAMALPLAIVGLATRRLLYGVAVAVLLFAIGISGSRGAVIGAIVGVLAVAVLDPRARRVVQLLAVGGCVLFMSGVTTGAIPLLERLTAQDNTVAVSDADRELLYSSVLSEVMDRPVVGSGYQLITGAHNIYLQALHAAGLVGLCALLTFVVGLVLTGFRMSRSDAQGLGSVARALLASCLSWLVGFGLVQPAIRDRYLYIPAALLVAIWALGQDRRDT